MEKNVVNYKAIGKRIKIVRIKRSMAQEKLAEKTGLSTQHMSNIENGNTKSSLPTIIRIANALSITVDELLCDSVTNSKEAINTIISVILEDCSEYEIRVLEGMLQGAKDALRQNDSFRDLD
ncbi:MAG: helix-turn-helix domain-containing protein [Saccharofermentanales bacterium]